MGRQSGRPPLLRVRHVAADLGVTPGRVYQLVAAGVVPAVRINRAVYVPRSAWEAWLRRRNEEALADLAAPRGPEPADGSAA